MPGRRRSASVTLSGTPTVARSPTALSSETLLLASPSASAAVRQRPVHQLSVIDRNHSQPIHSRCR